MTYRPARRGQPHPHAGMRPWPRRSLRALAAVAAVVLAGCGSPASDLAAPPTVASTPQPSPDPTRPPASPTPRDTPTTSPSATPTQPATPSPSPDNSPPPTSTPSHAPSEDTCERPEPGTFPRQGDPDPRLCLTLVLDATTVAQGGVLEGELIVENRSPDRIEVVHPSLCRTEDGFYRHAERVGSYMKTCGQEPTQTTFQPHQTHRFEVSLLACSVGGPSGPMSPGAYLAGAYLRLNEPPWYAPPVEVTVTAASDPAAAEAACSETRR
ncbi:MAG TPA: hypothetical protein VGA69_08150 [Nitriliruptorales bacterium]